MVERAGVAERAGEEGEEFVLSVPRLALPLPDERLEGLLPDEIPDEIPDERLEGLLGELLDELLGELLDELGLGGVALGVATVGL